MPPKLPASPARRLSGRIGKKGASSGASGDDSASGVESIDDRTMAIPTRHELETPDALGSTIISNLILSLRQFLNIKTHLSSKLFRYPRSFVAYDALSWLRSDACLGPAVPSEVAEKVLTGLEESLVIHRLTFGNASFGKSTLMRFNADEKRKYRSAVDRGKVKAVEDVLKEWDVAVKFNKRTETDAVGMLMQEDVEADEAVKALRERLRASPLSSSVLTALELIKELRDKEELAQHRAVLTYVIGVLSAGEAFQPLFVTSDMEGNDPVNDNSTGTESMDGEQLELRRYLLAHTRHFHGASARLSDLSKNPSSSRRKKKRRDGGSRAEDGGAESSSSAPTEQASEPNLFTPRRQGSLEDRALAALAEAKAKHGGTSDVVTADLMRDLCKWDFDMIAFANGAAKGRPLFYTGLALFKFHGLLKSFRIEEDVLERWLTQVEAGYSDNPYHNATHAADVAQSVNYFLTTCGMATLLNEIDVFAMILSALCHDLGHVGKNNAFLVNVSDPIAILHNDKSVLENHHVHRTFQVTLELDLPKEKRGQKGKHPNVFKNLDRAQYRQLRESVIELIISTDFGRHFEKMNQFKAKFASESGLDLEVREDKMLLMEIALKCADVAHTCKSRDLHLQWTKRITDEFYAQGDKEKELGLPVSPFMDRVTTDTAKSQAGFIEFLVAPLYKVWVEHFEQVQVCVDLLESNLAYWKDRVAPAKETEEEAKAKPVAKSGSSGHRKKSSLTKSTSSEQQKRKKKSNE